ncbi:hypothetical protein B0F90DRAFT_1809274 [Multifurca ochricompacta]|uniref:Uncharacterized protein n=1 Tax=Multifurca ochricompacta TaxID=376703 RepID=A0AAD4M754_9AGAM|nr:hypothetical protein B0F90DRAFT_1809274 [Multifurca ochricompacta]
MSSSSRSSTSSLGRPSSPLVGLQFPPELVLVNEIDSPNEELDFSSDDELPDEFSARLDRLNASTIPPISPTLVLLYLSAPYLKLGPMFLRTSDTPLSLSVAALAVSALFAAFTRQMWYLLARYLRKMDMEDVVLDAFARGPGKTRRRLLLRTIVRVSTIVIRILLASVSLRVSVDALLTLVPAHFLPIARGLFTMTLALALIPLYAAPSLATKRIICATWASVLAYLIWLGAVSYAYIKGTSSTDLHSQNVGILWQGITSTAFIFSSSWTLPLYAALRGSGPPAVTKRLRRRSFRALIATSVAITVALVLPLCLFASPLNIPSTPERGANAVIAISSAANLILIIPAILITIPPTHLPRAIRRTTSPTISKIIIYSITIALSVLSSKATVVLGDLLLVLSLLSTYVLPAILHITVHYFRRPLSIVLPTSVTRVEDGEGDELLQRKERSLQRRRFSRRIVWDAIAWVSVLPLGTGGSAWAIGRVLGKW